MIRPAITAFIALSLGACAPGAEAGNGDNDFVSYPPLSEQELTDIGPTLFVTNKRGN